MINLIATVAGRLGFNPKEAERFTKFLFVGTWGFVVDFGTLTLLLEVVDLPHLVAENSSLTVTAGLVLSNSISFTLAVISNFTLNRYWTYPESRSKRKRVQLPQFALVSIIGLVINNAIFASTTPLFNNLLLTLSDPQWLDGYIPAKMLATIVVLFWNFFVNRYWTYSNVK
ncbi:MAG: GtrA family protein [Chloroflexota bacterium]|jgi:putative flippase GtrA